MDLPNNILLYALLLIAVAAGYLLGRRELKRARPQSVVIKDYFQGLNFLLGERPDLSIDHFIEASAVSDSTVDVHMAMAGVLRRRGEVDKAIRVHQNVLATPSLSRANKQLVELELARDYHSAGLMDRAEKLLTHIVSLGGSQDVAARELLVDLYEQQQDWSQAVAVSRQLMKTKPEIRLRVSHFQCEIAERALVDRDVEGALEALKQAQTLAPDEPRAHWLEAKVQYQLKAYRKVLKSIQRAVELNPDLTAAYLDLYRSSCEKLASEGEFEKFLRACLTRSPNPDVLQALIHVRQENAQDIDAQHIIAEIARQPTSAHLPLLLQLDPNAAGVEALREQIATILGEEAAYQCGECGFLSHEVLWHCPTCKLWGTTRRASRGALKRGAS